MSKNTQQYNLDDALTKAVESGKARFDETVELHINCLLDVKKPEQAVRYTTNLPHGTGKEIKIAVFASEAIPEATLELKEADLKKIESGDIRPGSDFDILISEPKLMGKLAQVARILGPAGVMPNPKNGTITDDVKKAVKSFKQGKIEIRTEQTMPMIHTIIGKQSFGMDKLKENFNEIWSSLRSNKPAKSKPIWIESAFVSTSMGSAFQVDLNTL